MSQKNNEKNYSQEEIIGRMRSLSKVKTWTDLPCDIQEKIIDVTGPVQIKKNSIYKEEKVNWLPYVEDNIISHDDFSFINSYQFAETREERDDLLDYFKDQALSSLNDIVGNVSDIEDMQKLLVLIDDMFWEDESRASIFNPETAEPWEIFLPLLEWEDCFVQNLGSRIISFLLVASKGKAKQEDLKIFLNWLKDELHQDNPYLGSVARALQNMLRLEEYRTAFMTLSGVFKIVNLLSFRITPQVQYQFSFCLWVTSFTPQLAERMNRSGTIPVMADVLRSCSSEVIKLPRMIVATFRNLLEKPREAGVLKHNALVMLQCKVLTFLRSIEPKVEDSNDPEYEEDFQVVVDTLQSYVTELSSFDEYFLEIKSGRPEWSMVHKSKKFWVENAERLNENRYELLKILISLLETSKDNVVLCIAAHDLGEYMKQFSRGKRIVENLGGKKALITLLDHRHPAVKYYALKSLQILMLNNYELFTEFQNISKNLSEKWSDLNIS